jgi:cell migration-inducing and hyaluronan-binding protein
MSSNNIVQGAKFVNAKPVYFPPMEFKWSNDDYGNGSYQTSVFNDKDGSVSGVPNSYILINDANDGIAIDDACEIKPTWNAAVCKGDVGRMTVGAPAGGGGRGGRGAGAGPGGGRGGAPAVAGPGGRGGAAVAGGPGAGRGGLGGLVGPRNGVLGARAPAGPPVILSRNGKDLRVTGETNVRASSEIKVTTERPSLALSVKELDRGSWVIFELPGFTTAGSGTPQDSLDALREASATSYYKDKGSLWVKLVSTGDVLGSGPDSGPSGGASLQVNR